MTAASPAAAAFVPVGIDGAAALKAAPGAEAPALPASDAIAAAAAAAVAAEPRPLEEEGDLFVGFHQLLGLKMDQLDVSCVEKVIVSRDKVRTYIAVVYFINILTFIMGLI